MMPPAPTATRGPKSGSILAPTNSSATGLTCSWTRRPRTAPPAASARRSIASPEAASSSADRKPTCTSPASVLWIRPATRHAGGLRGRRQLGMDLAGQVRDRDKGEPDVLGSGRDGGEEARVAPGLLRPEPLRRVLQQRQGADLRMRSEDAGAAARDLR